MTIIRLAAAFGVAYLAFLIVIAFVTGQAWWLIALFGGVLPFLLWNYIMGTVIFMHHTGPDTVWFDKRAEWMRLRKVDDLTRDIHFPFRLEKLLHGIMLHRAHHYDPFIPNYRLKAATHRLHAGADALERQRLPCRKQFDLAGRHVLHEIVEQLAGVGSSRARNDERTALTQLRQCGDGNRARGFRNCDEPAGIAKRLHQRGIVAKKARE